MPECYFMPDPVFVHNSIAIYPTFRDDRLVDPRKYCFTTDPLAWEFNDPRSFDIRDYRSLVPLDVGPAHTHEYKEQVFLALTENPSHLPKAKGEEVEDLTIDGKLFFHATPEQDKAYLLAALISAQTENHWPAIKMHQITMPNGDTKSVFTVPSGSTPGTALHMSLIAFDQSLNSYNYTALMTAKPDRTIQTTCAWSDLISACCDVLGVKRPEHLKVPTCEKLNQSQEKAEANNAFPPAQKKDTER